MDLDLRKVRYFAAVAEHLNFGRAAEALHIAQPVLSRQIRALEHELKVQLFERDNRSTRLTPAGEALLEDARTLLPAADATRRRVRDVAAGQRTFTVGFMPGLIVTPAVRELCRRHPDLSVEVFRTDWTNQTDLIRDGRVDIGYLRLPADQHGLAIEPLFSEPRVVVLPADHRLAGKDAVTVADLAGEHLLQDPDAVPEWRDIAVELRGRQSRKAIPAVADRGGEAGARRRRARDRRAPAIHRHVLRPAGHRPHPRSRHRVQPGVPCLGQFPPQRPHPRIRRDCRRPTTSRRPDTR